jgi:hypothetical protein
MVLSSFQKSLKFGLLQKGTYTYFKFPSYSFLAIKYLKKYFISLAPIYFYLYIAFPA